MNLFSCGAPDTKNDKSYFERKIGVQVKCENKKYILNTYPSFSSFQIAAVLLLQFRSKNAFFMQSGILFAFYNFLFMWHLK